MFLRSFSKSVVVALLIFGLVGCGEIGIFGSKTKSFTGHDTVTLQSPRSDLLDVAAATGKDLGYEVSALDKERGTISLDSNAGALVGAMIGKINRTSLTVMVQDSGKKLALTISIYANFNEGGQEAAQKRMDEFKEKLGEKLGG